MLSFCLSAPLLKPRSIRLKPGSIRMASSDAAYGTWKSPITSEAIVKGSIALGGVVPRGNELFWLEGRPQEGGRNVLVRSNSESTREDVTPMPLNIRTRVHEYGGGSFLMAGEWLYFCNFADQRLYKQHLSGTIEDPQPLTAEGSGRRFADMVLDSDRGRLICVCENHVEEGKEPSTTLVTVDIESGSVVDIVSGSDFYASPRLSPDGKQLCWVEWQHPNMPWDRTALRLCPILSDGSLGSAETIIGAELAESVCAPRWSPDGQLFFISDRSDFWNIYRVEDGKVLPVCSRDAEFAGPAWAFGSSLYCFLNPQTILCASKDAGSFWTLGTIDVGTGTLEQLKITKDGEELKLSSVSSLSAVDGKAHMILSTPISPPAVVVLDLETKEVKNLVSSSDLDFDVGYISVAGPLEFPTTEGTSYGWYYPPKNKDFTASSDEKPPLRVLSHGGPTSEANSALNLRVQYWTSRGYAVVDVNYGGSSGFGRRYRQRLNGKWGIVDVDDCVNAAKYLSSIGQADENRLTISGGSAGGFTTLAALTMRKVFRSGASHYGVSDLRALARDTHKFESRYLDGLIGPYPEDEAVYIERSPLTHAENLSCPVIFFQGLEDKIVPPNQAEMMVDVLVEKQVPVSYVTFEGEQHGFRQAKNIRTALDGEFYFYSRVFGFKPAEEHDLPDLIIQNEDKLPK